jgi:hypothetical protein
MNSGVTPSVMPIAVTGSILDLRLLKYLVNCSNGEGNLHTTLFLQCNSHHATAPLAEYSSLSYDILVNTQLRTFHVPISPNRSQLIFVSNHEAKAGYATSFALSEKSRDKMITEPYWSRAVRPDLPIPEIGQSVGKLPPI